MLLSQKSYFINKTWLLINEKNDLTQYTFKTNNEIIISTNGDVIKGNWELLSETKILIETQIASIQLENLFFDKNIIVLLKPSLIEELFILIDEKVVKDPFKYLNDLKQNKQFEDTEPDPATGNAIAVTIIIIIGLLLFGLILPK